MWTFDMLGSVVLVLALATVFLMVLVARTHKSGKDLPIWLGSGLAGMLLGAAAIAATFSLMGYEVMSAREMRLIAEQNSAAPPLNPQASASPMGGGPGAGGMMGGGGMGGGGMGGMMGGGGMGGRQPSSKRQLTTLVRKLDLLTGDIAIHFTADQATAVQTALAELDAQEKMTEDDAKAAHDKLLGILDDGQKARQDAIGLPFRRGGPGGAPGGGAPGGGAPGGGPGAGTPPAPDANPFAEEENSKSLRTLRGRLGGTPAGETPAAEQPTEKPAEEKPAAEQPAAEPAKP